MLDNCEHVLEPRRSSASCSRPAPASRCWRRAASRSHAGRAALPGAAASPSGDGRDAVELFAERARAHDPHSSSRRQRRPRSPRSAARLDGLPLAIELAAARCALLAPDEIAQRLDAARALSAGARDAPDRQRTLRATIDWSYALLDDEEKACFARFAVFAGGATVDAAEAVTGADLDTLDHLVAKSLLVRRRQPATGRGFRCSRRSASTRAAASRPTPTPTPSASAIAATTSSSPSHATQRALWAPIASAHLAVLDADHR